LAVAPAGRSTASYTITRDATGDTTSHQLAISRSQDRPASSATRSMIS
jgi:hypothetical protein